MILGLKRDRMNATEARRLPSMRAGMLYTNNHLHRHRRHNRHRRRHHHRRRRHHGNHDHHIAGQAELIKPQNRNDLQKWIFLRKRVCGCLDQAVHLQHCDLGA